MEKHNFQIIRANLQIVSPVIGFDLSENIRFLAHVVLDLLISPFPLVLPPPHIVSSVVVSSLNVPLFPGLSTDDPLAALASDDGWELIKPLVPPLGWELVWFPIWHLSSSSPMDICE